MRTPPPPRPPSVSPASPRFSLHRKAIFMRISLALSTFPDSLVPSAVFAIFVYICFVFCIFVFFLWGGGGLWGVEASIWWAGAPRFGPSARVLWQDISTTPRKKRTRETLPVSRKQSNPLPPPALPTPPPSPKQPPPCPGQQNGVRFFIFIFFSYTCRCCMLWRGKLLSYFRIFHCVRLYGEVVLLYTALFG